MAAVAAIKHAMKKKQEKQKVVERQKKERTERDLRQVEAWFESIDIENKGVLEKAQVSALLHSIDPDAPVEESLEYVAFLGAVTKENIVQVVKQFRFFAKQWKAFEDILKERFGNTEYFRIDEVHSLMKQMSENKATLAEAQTLFHGETIHRGALLPVLAAWCQEKIDQQQQEEEHNTEDDTVFPQRHNEEAGYSKVCIIL